jgi:hypothetical protein
VIVYEPRGAARDLWKCKAPEVLIEGPAGTGKTRGILQKIVALADKYPGSRHLICRKTRASMTESVLVTLETKVLPSGHPILSGPQRSHRTHYDFPNGSTIVVGGMDNATRTFSTEYDTVTYFEAIEGSEDEWENLHRALRNGRMGYHQAIADTNPGQQSHWLNQRASTDKMTRLISRHEDNPELYDADAGTWTPHGAQYIARLDGLTGVRRLRLRLGLWASAEGIVYESWDPSVHLVPRFEIPKDWPRYWVVDFGYTNPFCWEAWAKDPDDRLYRYREIYRTGRLVEDHAKDILKAVASDPAPQAIVCDHDAEGRATLERYLKMRTTPAFKAISPGIQAVEKRLARAGDGRPRLLCLRDSLVNRDEKLIEAKKPVCSEEEIEGYVWPKGQDGKPNKEAPVKEDDHGMDCWRYLVAHVDKIRTGPQQKATSRAA